MQTVAKIIGYPAVLLGMWFERSAKNQRHSTHNHGACGYSAVLYVDFDPEVHEGMRIAATELKQDDLVKRETKALERLRHEPSSARLATEDKEHGFITITSSPWADVLIDDEPLKRATPLTDYPVAVGTSRITLRNSALSLERSLDVKVELGQTTTLSVELKEDQ